MQLGGPSGGCLPAELLDTPIDFESLTSYGSMMGSGGMVVTDDSTCMVDFAKYFFDLHRPGERAASACPAAWAPSGSSRSSSASPPARAPTTTSSCLEQLSDDVTEGSLCQLGGSAANPVLTTLRYFRDEYIAHVVESAARPRSAGRSSATP